MRMCNLCYADINVKRKEKGEEEKEEKKEEERNDGRALRQYKKNEKFLTTDLQNRIERLYLYLSKHIKQNNLSILTIKTRYGI